MSKNTKTKIEKKEVINIWNEEMLDDMHFSWDEVFGYQKKWNFVIGERISGKSVNSWIKVFNAFYYNGYPSLVLRRRIADITSAYIDDTATLLNKFLKPEYHIKLLYLKGDVQSGIADIKVGKADEEYNYNEIKALPTFFRVIGLSCPMNRIKSLVLRNVKYVFFDEFLAHTRGGEKYLAGDEHFLISEILITYQREAKHAIKVIAAGNPYSVYCPIFSGLDVDSGKLKPGAFVVGTNYVIDCFEAPPELKEYNKQMNAGTAEDNSEYARYAFGGMSISDANIRINKHEPAGFKLKWIFKIGNNFLSIHRGSYKDKEGIAKYWICKHDANWLEKVGKRRKMIVFDYGDLIAGSVKWSALDRQEFSALKDAMDQRQIMYNTIDSSYMIEDLSVYF